MLPRSLNPIFKVYGSRRLVISVFLMTLVGVTLLSYSIPSKLEAQLAKVRIAEIHSLELSLASHVALAKGYFREEGIDAEIVSLAGGVKVREALIAGEFDYALIGLSTISVAWDKGVPVKVLVTTYEREIFSLLVRSDLKDQIKGVADLRGRTVGIVGFGTAAWVYADYFFKKSGLDPNKDVKLAPVGVLDTQYAAIKAKKIDAVVSWEPLVTQTLARGETYALIPMWRTDVHSKWIGEKAMAHVLVALENTIKQKPDITRKLVVAHKRALSLIRKSTPEELAKLAAPYWRGVEESVLLEVFKKLKEGYGDGSLSRKAYETLMDIFFGAEIIKSKIAFEKAVFPDYAGTVP